MGEICVVVEHRQGVIREITHQMLWKAHELCQALSCDLTAVVISGGEEGFYGEIAERADRVIAFEGEAGTYFNGETYKEILHRLIEERRPFLTLMAHSAYGMAYAPSLSVKTGLPLATDAVDILLEDGHPKVIRQIYTGKIFSKVAFKEADGYLVTVREGAFPADRAGAYGGEVIREEIPSGASGSRRQFVAFEESEAGDVDICQAELLVSVGRGIGDRENLQDLKSLSDLMGGVLSCSRPVVDKHWLPKFHQVGTSGKTVKPKVYLALGISGAFQHVAGISGAGTVIAVNKDEKAPIFRVAHYGVVEDLFTVARALKEKLAS